MDNKPGILKVLHAVAGAETNPAPDESLFDSGLLDSFLLNDLILGLEDEFKITIPDSDISARKFDTLTRIEQYVASKQAK
jgi:acyl carrier protein